MQKDFTLFVPLTKGFSPEGISKIVETNAKGESRTRYKLFGTASTTSLDRDGEVVTKHAMLDMAKQINAKKLPIFGNHQHDWENMLGYADTAELSQSGEELNIVITTDYEETNPKVNQLIGKLEGELPISLSIGGKVKDAKAEFHQGAGKDVNHIYRVGLLETSVVGIGANQDAFLSLAKYLKSKEEDDDMNVTKTAGQSGELSYGKMGETTPQAKCPFCGQPSELREVVEREAHYVCQACNTAFTVNVAGKTDPIPENQPSNKPGNTIDRQVQAPLGSSKSTKIDLSKNTESKGYTRYGATREERRDNDGGPLMAVDPNDGYPNYGRKPKLKGQGDTMDENENETAEKEQEVEETENKESDDEDAEYKRFVGHMKRFQKEIREKAEGMTTPPGDENADAKNTMGGSESTSPENQQKNAKGISMRKAFGENFGAETLMDQNQEIAFDGTFKSFRDSMMKK